MVAAARHTAATNCIGCHMPKRRTDDVVHVVMTDHYIQRNIRAGDLLAEKPEANEAETVYHGEVLPYYPQPFAPAPENDLHLALAQVRADTNLDAGLAPFAAAVEKYKPRRRSSTSSWPMRMCATGRPRAPSRGIRKPFGENRIPWPVCVAWQRRSKSPETPVKRPRPSIGPYNSIPPTPSCSRSWPSPRKTRKAGRSARGARKISGAR